MRSSQFQKMAARRFTLPANVYSGIVAGVSVSYNPETLNYLANLRDFELKKFAEDAAVTAALSRGASKVTIR